MNSRTKKIMELARRESENREVTLIDRLENEPDFINSLPIEWIDDQNNIISPEIKSMENNTSVGQTTNTADIDSSYHLELNSSMINNDQSSTFSMVEMQNFEIAFDNIDYCQNNTEDQPIQFVPNESENNLPFSPTYNIENANDNDLYSESNTLSSAYFADNINAKTIQSPRLVDYSDSSDVSEVESESEMPKRKRRKRCQVDKKTWAYEANRKNREKGLKYFGRKQHNDTWDNRVPKSPRILKERCKCKTQKTGKIRCALITEQDRKGIFDKFWEMTWGEKKIYLDSLMQIIPTDRPRDRKHELLSRRSSSVIYNLKKGEEFVRVCKTLFLNTLCIGKWCALNWKNSMKMGKAKNQNEEDKNPAATTSKISKINPFEKENKAMCEFFESLPTMESHYCRKSTEKKYLLPEWPSKKSVYDVYVKWCNERNVKALSVCTFNNAFDVKNFGLYQPKKDQCSTCFSHKLGQHEDEQKYDLHIKMKEEARKEKELDKDGEFVFTMDLQAVLLAPRSNVSSLYYRTKLCVHNFCLFNLKTKQGTCYLWNETEGGLNAEEFATLVSKFLLEKVVPQIREKDNDKIILYSDGCTYQNRNVTMSNALLNLAVINNIVIEQKFLEVGHTQMEVDSMHALIERQLKNKTINVPAEYIPICRKARKAPEPYAVEYITHNTFKNFQDIKFLKAIRPGNMKGDPKVRLFIIVF